MNKTYKKIILAVLASVTIAGTASAQIYEDKFSYTGALPGNAPDTHDTNGNVWLGLTWSSAPIYANGTAATGQNYPSGASYGGSFLPVNSAGVTLDGSLGFTLSATVNTTIFTNGDPSSPAGIELLDSTTPQSSQANVFLAPEAGFFATLGVNSAGGASGFFNGGSIGTLAGSNTALLQIVYTPGGSPTLSFYDNSVLVSSQSVTVAQIQALTDVGINVDYPNHSTITDFTLTLAAAPEPSTYALLLAGLAGLVFFARRRSLV
ncbi:MAG: PEP-CTERM sorting domain-containing protein [Methylacidiphilales bacterium]|nr:PEP-CTERM sorting domain-containing protein [Candidatus Methylacidiphilales bacterium]